MIRNLNLVILDLSQAKSFSEIFFGSIALFSKGKVFSEKTNRRILLIVSSTATTRGIQ